MGSGEWGVGRLGGGEGESGRQGEGRLGDGEKELSPCPLVPLSPLSPLSPQSLVPSR
ncbi:hypothetical protein [Tolypothrix sp. VBCCA 56010]|uniref:hypothetical protein n=1 Tax=Tolypothrix sp. VBCCA 56010 TaxID=3137731 RepID=UPI003D7CA229